VSDEETYQRSEFRSKRGYVEGYQEERDGDSFTNVFQDRLITWTDTLSGFKNPKWRAQVKAGVNATTAMTAYETKINAGTFSLQIYLNKKGLTSPNDWVYGDLAGQYIPSRWSQSSVLALPEGLANAQALASYVKAINKQQRSFQGGVAVGELTEAIRMIKNPASALRGGLSSYLDGVKKRLRRERKSKRRKLREDEVSKTVGGLWLEYSFGWIPFLNDLDDGIKAIAESGVLQRNWRKPVQGIGRDSQVMFDEVITIGNTWPQWIGRQVDVSTVLVIYSGSVDSGSYAAYSPRRVGFSPQDWAPAVWELLPWSFLIDYFSNVGEIISAASLAQSGLAWSNKTVVKTIERRLIGSGHLWFNAPHLYSHSFSGGLFSKPSSTSKTVSRSAYTGSLVPDLVFSTPGSGLKWLNMAALGAQSKSVMKFIKNLIF
jgi:DNA-binding transcriptional ArsR family regulator